MIKKFSVNDANIELSCDPAGQHPLYLYCQPSSTNAYYSKNLKALLDHQDVTHEPNIDGISFLLQSGITPPPLTAYKYIYIIGSGDTCRLNSKNGYISLEFSYHFPFSQELLPNDNSDTPDSSLLLEAIANAVITGVKTNAPNFLFQTSGKDSNLIALALAEAGWQNKVMCLTQSFHGEKDESALAKKIAAKMGFKHTSLPEIYSFDIAKTQRIESYFSKAPLPSLDKVTLAYAQYPGIIPELIESNIIDGSGSDRYLFNPPNTKQTRTITSAKRLVKLSQFRGLVTGNSKSLRSLFSTPAERVGLRGFSYQETKSIFPEAVDCVDYWIEQSNSRKNWNILDFKSDLKSRYIDNEMYLRKVRNIADVWDANLLLPLTHPKVVELSRARPIEQIVQLNPTRNKVFVRELLKTKMELDSDSIGKYGYAYDYKRVIQENKQWFHSTIMSCTLWQKINMEHLLNRLWKSVEKESSHESRQLYRLALISGWHNARFNA